jgi:type VI secretion system secreted protein VgrG
MTPSQVFQLNVDGANVQWVIAHVAGSERLHAPFSFDVTCMPFGNGLTRVGHDKLAHSLPTKTAALTWNFSRGERVVHAIVEEVDVAQPSWTIRLVPRIATLQDAVDHQVFLDSDAVEICKKVLAEHGFAVDSRVVRALPKRAQCVQAFESDLSFVSRLLAEEGVNWFCDPTRVDGLVFADNVGGFHDLAGGPVPDVEEAGMAGGVHAFDLKLTQTVTPEKVTLRDFNFKTPALDLTADAPQGANGSLEAYDYRANYTTVDAGRKIAAVHLDAHRATRRVLRGRTDASDLLVGSVLTLQSARSDLNGKWIVIELLHEATENNQEIEERRYEAAFVAVPAAVTYRPPLPASPKLGGVQNMKVTGASGAEIHTDDFGQIKAHLRWDRRRPFDDTSSAWFRAANPPTSGGFMLPRVEWEVLSAFWGTSADTPIELGRLYNGISTPPSSLPAKKVVSAFGSLTTPGGAGANLIQTDDTAGNEAMNLHASKDFNEKTENDKMTNVTAADTHTVGGDRTLSVGKVHGIKVAASQTHSVAASRTVHIGANKAIEAATESVSIGALRAFNVAGDSTTQCATLARLVGGSKIEACIEHQSILVSGASAVVIGAGWTQLAGLGAHVVVGGAQKEEVSGAKSIKALSYGLSVSGSYSESYSSRDIDSKGEVQESFAASCTYDVSGDATFKGADVFVNADDKITIKADGITVTITDGEVTIDGEFESSQDSKETTDEDYE